MSADSAPAARAQEVAAAAFAAALAAALRIDDAAAREPRPAVAAQIENGLAKIEFDLPFPARELFSNQIKPQVESALAAAGFENARVEAAVAVHSRQAQGGAQRVAGVKNIVAVASAKGGVGKSTTAVNLALALAREGAQVGILDADIYGPSLPVLCGIDRRARGDDGGRIEPIVAHGLKVMSMGFLVGDDQPMVWRGPMATRALTQLLRETAWGEIDYLILDMPPGTGDLQLTIAQQAPVTGAVVVTTPQDLALADALRGIKMFDKVGVSTLGVVENMSVFVCPGCGEKSRLFGEGGAQKLARRCGVEALGEIPLEPAICAEADSGIPTVAARPDSETAAEYRRVAIRVARQIAVKARDLSSSFPKIVISET